MKKTIADENRKVKRIEEAETLFRSINLHNQKWSLGSLYDRGYNNLPSEYIGDVMKLYIKGADAEYMEWDIEGSRAEDDWNETRNPSWNWQHCLYKVVMPMEEYYHVER